ncbi:MAG: hypothetical protein R3A13_09125 [Bdellovibrionota bacterium]
MPSNQTNCPSTKPVTELDVSAAKVQDIIGCMLRGERYATAVVTGDLIQTTQIVERHSPRTLELMHRLREQQKLADGKD